MLVQDLPPPLAQRQTWGQRMLLGLVQSRGKNRCLTTSLMSQILVGIPTLRLKVQLIAVYVAMSSDLDWNLKHITLRIIPRLIPCFSRGCKRKKAMQPENKAFPKYYCAPLPPSPFCIAVIITSSVLLISQSRLELM